MKLSKTLHDRVKDLLIRYPKYRDDMPSLVNHIWKEDIKNETGFSAKTISFNQFDKLFKSGKLSNTESCRRYWQMIQHSMPALRGLDYEKRHGHQEKVKKHLKNVA